ncbi:hypothetical protein L0244_10265, partial [bacterium]|nr:hypothetical protein [bacterium]
DQLGTPSEVMDKDGTLVWSVSLNSLGKEVNRASTNLVKVDCPIRFQGQWRDDENNLAYNRFRYYDSETGHFICEDPLGLLGGINLFLFAQNPINWIDPLGLTSSPGGCGSPDIDPKEVAGKTPDEIDALARSKGLIPKGPDPKAGSGAYVDPATGQQRVLIHPNDPKSGPHAHVNNPAGERLDINKNVVPNESPAAHLPLKTS